MVEKKIQYFILATTAGAKIVATKKGKGAMQEIKEEEFADSSRVLAELKNTLEQAIK